MSGAKVTKSSVIFATEQTLRLIEKTEVESPELKKSYEDVIRHLKNVVGPKFQGM